MEDLEEINKKTDEYTGNAINFKRGIVYEDDPEFGDTVRITSIVTGLKFSDVLGHNRDLGNYIIIDNDFVYDRQALAQGEGIPLGADSLQPTILGYGKRLNQRKFNFQPDEKPCLILDQGQSVAELENTAAIRRLI